MALAYLWSLDPGHLHEQFEDIVKRWPEDKLRIVVQMLERNINAPLTSSCGRLFDAVSSIAGLRDTINYEGQAAIEFEQAMENDDGSYIGKVLKERGMWILDPLPMIVEAVEDVRRGLLPGIISARFHNGVVSLLADASLAARAETGLKRIALSGGVFQNAYLFENLVGALRAREFEVYSHVEVPANDACIALGQAYVAAHRLIKESRKD